MAEVEAEFPAQVIERRLRVLIVGQQGVARLNLGKPPRLPMPLMPRPGQFASLLELLRVQKMEALVVVIVVRAGDQLLQRHRPVGGQRKLLDEPDFASPPRGDTRPTRHPGQNNRSHQYNAAHERLLC